MIRDKSIGKSPDLNKPGIPEKIPLPRHPKPSGPGIKVKVSQEPTLLEGITWSIFVLLSALLAFLILAASSRIVNLEKWNYSGGVTISGSYVGSGSGGILEGAWTPDRILVIRGKPVTLNVTAVDANHLFSLPAFGINIWIHRGETRVFHFTPERPGTFSFGNSTPGMSGRLIVLEK